MFMPLFSEMVAATPALHAAWLELHARLVEVATQALAEHAEVDPRDPEPMIAARAIVGLLEVEYASRIRHIEAGLRGAELRDAVHADLERAARMLDTGLWSFDLLTQGARTRQQLREAALAAEDARTQVIDALKHARAAWQELRPAASTQDRHAHARERTRRTHASERRSRDASDESASSPRSSRRPSRPPSRSRRAEAVSAAKRGASRVGEAAWKAAREQGKKSLREAHARAERAAYEAFRQMLGERHEAVREREAALRRWGVGGEQDTARRQGEAD